MADLKEKIRPIVRKFLGKKDIFYQAFKLSSASRKELLEKFPPKHKTTVAHHITYVYDSEEKEPEMPKSVKIVGIAEDERVQALVAEVNGTTKRPDGKIYHITWSLAEGAKAMESNKLVQKGYKKISPIKITVEPSLEKRKSI